MTVTVVLAPTGPPSAASYGYRTSSATANCPSHAESTTTACHRDLDLISIYQPIVNTF